ncbi:hypothetical protein BCR33DRAFT_738744 [Rhizoclosmatium globosum]|uniref:Uncharacterized protein n=1 Tax=Rhizoclosmatium globosum TaxID=329046 RepID=A0A1Y2CAZ1_9FUNG|nr:hypothetical protein BCR33DRAFT_738744 [Rhizoclosmatium globosum]|eukprot:ORY43505.1 hypothetical protein BCR33DRAFT_738744 [Rhizoclosmatium globosum]
MSPNQSQSQSQNQNQTQFYTPNETLSPLKKLLASTSKQSGPSSKQQQLLAQPTTTTTTTVQPIQPIKPKQWETPKLALVQSLHQSTAFSTLDSTRLVWNVFALVVLVATWAGGYLTLIAALTSTSYQSIITAFLVVLAVPTLNVSLLIPKLLKKDEKPNFSKVPLTPREKVLLGVDKKESFKPEELVAHQRSNGTPIKQQSFLRGSGSMNSSLFSTPLTRPSAASTTAASQPQTPAQNSTNANAKSLPQSIFASPSTSTLPNSPLTAQTSLLSTTTPIRDLNSLQRLLQESSDTTSTATLTPSNQKSPFPRSSTSSTPLRQSQPSLSTMPLSNAGKFQPASTSKPTTSTKKQDRIEGGFLIRDPLSVVTHLGVESVIDAWGEGMRWWISDRVVKVLVGRIEAWEKSVPSLGWDLANVGVGCVWGGGVLNPMAGGQQQQQPQSGFGGGSLFGAKPAATSLFGASQPATSSLFGGGASTSTFGGFGASTSTFGGSTQQPQQQPGTGPKPQNLYDLQNMYGTNPLAQERLKIETYLWMPEYPGSRSYVIDRIQALARSGGLASFQWDVSTSGTTGTALFSQSLSSVVGFFTAQRSINDKQSSTSTSTATPSNNNTTTATNTLPVKVPSDAEIVVHLVCKFFDEQMGGWNNAFTTKYYVGVEQKPGDLLDFHKKSTQVFN